MHPDTNLLVAVVQHEVRLNILCCIYLAESMSIDQVCHRTGLRVRQVEHHLRILDAFGLVSDTKDIGDEEALYVTHLKSMPPARVMRAVNRHLHRMAAE